MRRRGLGAGGGRGRLFPVRFYWLKLDSFVQGRRPEPALQPPRAASRPGPAGIVQETHGVGRGGDAGAPPWVSSALCPTLPSAGSGAEAEQDGHPGHTKPRSPLGLDSVENTTRLKKLV